VPSLVDACPDCPEDLENILFHMMAKAPDERFDTPGELADALALFADPDELVACVPAVAPAPSANGATPGIAGTDPGSSRRVVRRSGERRKSSSSRLRRPRWYQRPVWWGALALVALVLFNLWMLLGNRREVAPVEPPTAAADEARQLAIELALLPGLNGQWWFDEMPWYLPFVRQAVAEKLVAAGDPAAVLGANPRGYLEPNIADVQKWLSDVVARCASALPPRQRTLLEELRSLSATNLSDTQLADRLERSLEHFVKSQSEKSASAVDLHTQALLQHKLAPWRNGQGFTERARVSYEAAQKRYAETAIPTGVPLQQLCLADAALLCTKVLGDFDEARQLFDKALTHDPLPPLFAAETRVAYGSAMASAGQYEDHLFVSAKKLLDECGASKRNHPLAARACEGYAWSLMDQWKVEDAGKQFQEAYNIRWSNKRAENPFATIYVFHNRHGTAITLRYRGNVESARRVFKTLVGDPTQVGEKNVAGEIPSALQEAEQASERPGQQRYLRDLRERWANSMERWADCELYGGAACGIPVNLARAASLYEKASTLNQDLDLGTKLVMTCKLCIVLALHGQTDAARKVFSAVEAGPKTVRGPDRERSELCRQVAQAVLRLKDALGPADGQKALRGFLDQFKLNPTYTDSSRRETLELQLFCAALLLSSDLETVQTEAAERDRKYLDPLLATFRGRKDMRPFLRGFYDLAIRACDKSDLVAVAQYLLEARAVDRQESLRSDRATLVLFHFSPDENFVVFLPQDGRPGKLVPLEVTREQIKSAASRGQRLRLPDELVKTIQGETQAGRALNVSWADTMCWASEDAGLADAEWPFADQLDLAALHASAHPSQPGDESR
jgi:tetratricopeptide (TPR) repeat protein